MQKVYSITPSSLFKFLLNIFLFLLVMNFLSIGIHYYFTQTNRSSYLIDTFVVKLFYFDAEKNIPAFFSTFNLLLCAALLVVISKADKGHYNKRWFYLAFVFVFLALDELISIHEVLTGPSRAIMQRLLGSQQLGILYYAWVVPYAVLLVVGAIYFYKFVFSLPRKILINFIVAAGIFLTGAVVMEMLGGYLAERFGIASFAFKVSSTLEESLEMLGIIFFARTLVQYLSLLPRTTDVVFRFNSGHTFEPRSAEVLKTQVIPEAEGLR